MERDARFVEYLNHEYRVTPAPNHKWQREREAFLAGETVEFRNKEVNGQIWYSVGLMPDFVLDKKEFWDRDWLEFRIKPVVYAQNKRVQARIPGSALVSN